MRHIFIILLFILLALGASAQYTPNAGAYQYKGLKQINSLQPPSTAGSPVTSINAPDSNYAALYYNKTDTTWYQFNPISKTWSPFRANGGVTIDSIFISSIDSIFITQTDSIFIITGADTIYIGESDHVRDTAKLNAGYGTVILSAEDNDSLGFYGPNYTDRTIMVDTSILDDFITQVINSDTTFINNPASDTARFIVDTIANSPPPGVTDGYKVLVGAVNGSIVVANPTGDFAGHDEEVAELVGSVWNFTVPDNNDQLIVDNADSYTTWQYQTGTWRQTARLVRWGGDRAIGENAYIGRNDSVHVPIRAGNYIGLIVEPDQDIITPKYEGLENEPLFYKPGPDGKLDTGRFTIPEYDSPAIQDSIMYLDAGVIKYGTASGGGSGGTTDVQSITATAGQDDFVFTSVPASEDDYFLTVNGVVWEQDEYTESGDTITLTVSLDDGDIVSIRRIK